MEWRDVDWIDLTHERERGSGVVNAVMNRRVPYNAGNFWLAEDLLASQAEIFFLGLMGFFHVIGLQF